MTTIQLLLHQLSMPKKRKPAAQKIVDQKMELGHCLCACPKRGEQGCTRSFTEPGGGLGNCAKHYRRLKDEQKNRDDAEQRAILNREAKAGRSLWPQEIREYQPA